MAEYIEREALLDAIEGTDWYHVSLQGNLVHGAISDGNALYKADDIFKVLEDAPAADVVPVVHGDWEKQSGIYSCSVCGKACPYHTEDGVIWYWHCEFCPHCGAKMDLEG